MTTQDERTQIMKTIMEVLEVEDTVQEALARELYTTPRKLHRASQDNVESALANQGVSDTDSYEIKLFKEWMDSYTENGTKLPITEQEWKDTFTQDAYDTFITEKKNDTKFRDAHSVKSVSTTTSNSGGTKSKIKISLNDFPTFKGTQVEWASAKAQFESLFGLMEAGYGDLLDITTDDEVKTHLERRIQDTDYNKMVEDVHSILTQKSATGTAKVMVKAHNATKDGVLAWKDWCEYYDHAGNSATRGTALLGELSKLRLYNDSHGGFNKYQSDFEDRCLELEDMGQGLTGLQKKTFLIQGIQDRDYQGVKDSCDELDYRGTVLKLRKKALDLGTIDKPDPNLRRRNQKQNNQQHNQSPSSFPDEVWTKLSRENQKWIMDHKEKDRQEHYGMQYSKDKEETDKGTPSKGRQSEEKDFHVTEDASSDDKKKVHMNMKTASDEDDVPQSVYRPPQKVKGKK